MAATSACVVSSVVAASTANSHVATATRTIASYGTLLSTRRASFKTGVVVPATARSAAFRTEPKKYLTIVAAKATKDPETTVESTVDDTSAAFEDALKSVQEAWEKTDDKVAIAGLGLAGLVAIWSAAGLINAVDKLPLIPDFFEFVGILFSGWFVYRYLLFKPDREVLFKFIDETMTKITGQ
ncbi:protein CURVATURE THYLAKOID 1B, chloroplastic [Physcomitrium patens]|uniref:Cyanobacterial aminoacyl-tRNA synthetase CAAD domain-containing protein n=1 Tax=Physcomitrium patens TaxID=3218 RepID=A9S7F4_PHYPA|nr:protein CURVATURE THYLAKOID 1B, chloroplastic-like [Physcomitrium patens]PNR26342.1 hypothetical protein PHYPA_030917 [Physcomitrium patens]|eukprot:XP_024367938.1 protein CURVATURE THYLAKOID 1B, chloroplastic-like [Physcomitrella patens]